VTYGTNGWITSNMKSKLQKAGYKIVDDPFLVSDAKYCVRGAIYVKASAHTACGLDNGTEYAKTLAAAQVADAGEIRENKTYVGQGIGTATSNSTMNIREKTSTSSYSYGVIKPGAQVEVLEIVEAAGQTWFKIVWTWAEEGMLIPLTLLENIMIMYQKRLWTLLTLNQVLLLSQKSLPRSPFQPLNMLNPRVIR
jgi:hypothetical protein